MTRGAAGGAEAGQWALRAAQAEMTEKERLALLAEIAVGLHHSILNPIAGILGALRVLRDDCAPQVKGEALARAELELHRIERVITRLPSLRRMPVTCYVGETNMLDLERAITEEEPRDEHA